MLIVDLEYLQSIRRLKEIEGGVDSYAEAEANASNGFAIADALAVAEGEYASVSTKTSVTLSSGKLINYSTAYAGAFASARTGNKLSISFDAAFDADASPNR